MRPTPFMLFVWFAACCAGLPAAAEEPDYRGTVPLHTPPLRTPIETAGTGLAPEVTIRVEVDATGRVRTVKVQAIEPSSEFDELFRQVTVDTLMRWRYAPAIRDGEPDASVLSWTIQFRPRAEKEGPEVPAFAWRAFSVAEDSSRDFHRRILALPLEQRRRLLQQQAGHAERHLDQDKLAKATSHRFRVVTDAPKGELADVLVTNLEAVFNTLHGLLGEKLAPQPEPYRILVFMYASRAGFDGLKRDVQGIEWSSGFYNPAGLIAFHMQMPSNEALLSTMIHEATHAYLDRYVTRPGVMLPRWLGEGFADYVSNSTIRKRKIVPGRTRKAELYRGPWGVVRGKAAALFSLDDVKQAVRRGEAVTLDELIDADRNTFYGDKRRMFYTMAWVLVHFLRHGEAGWDQEKFPSLMLYVAEGFPARDAFRAVYGEPADLEEAFRAYVKKF